MEQQYITTFHKDMPDEAFIVFFLIVVLIIAFFAILTTILFVLAYCKVFKKAGYSWAWGLLWLVPFGNVILLLVLAFSDWPVLKEIRKLKSGPSSAGSPPAAAS